jgi:5-methylcytosine-specific restriction endonuclease McrA
MGEWSWNALKQFVYERANGCCEYCQTCETNSGQTMQVDHIDPQGGMHWKICVYPAGIAIAVSTRQRW